MRAILWRHASQGRSNAPDPAATSRSDGRAQGPSPAGARDPGIPVAPPDPNALLPVDDLGRILAALPREDQRRLGKDYAALWARTFRTLVTHLRGRPERALALFAEEVYPFLRGHRLAARVEAAGHRRATLVLAGGLPDAYLCGLVEGFVGLSGATATTTATAPGRVDVSYRVQPADRLARIAQHAAGLRLNLVAAALLAALLGIALAATQGAEPAPLRVALVLAGIAAAQLAANALHVLHHDHPAGPLAPLRAARPALGAQTLGAGALALLCGTWLAVTGTPLVLLFAAAGVATGFLYGPLRDRGLGPIVILALYGPLIVEGALHAFAVGAHHLDHVALLRWTLVPGALAAATLYLDDLADAPLDEAGGKRTLAVRLPRRSQGIVYTGLLSIGLAPLLPLVQERSFAVATLVLALAALALAVQVRRALDEPRRLAPARLGTQALHAAATMLVAAFLGGLL